MKKEEFVFDEFPEGVYIIEIYDFEKFKKMCYNGFSSETGPIIRKILKDGYIPVVLNSGELSFANRKLIKDTKINLDKYQYTISSNFWSDRRNDKA